ncbi:Hypothetical protein D9617_16g015810 [Elsinoe fawcettii]|nr:Hypothetical protein D9617_16g015810 [Elsinoe fawcettii]
MLIGYFDEAILPSKHDSRESLARWAPHFNGAQKVLAACRPSSFDLSNTVHTETLLGFWMMAWFLSLAQCRAMEAGLKMWRRFGMAHALTGSSLDSWHELVLPLPGLFSLLNRGFHGSGREADRLNTLKVLLTARTRLGHWLDYYMLDTPSIATGNAEDLDISNEEHFYVALIDPLFEQQYQFLDMQRVR